MLALTYQILFLAAPLFLAGVAHGCCIKFDWFSPLKKPLDHHMCFRGKRLFGDHKTWRGLVINTVFCTIGAVVQAWLQKQRMFPKWLFLVDYTSYGLLTGIFLGLGMTLGELPNSFLKRQLDISPGKSKRGLMGVLFFLYDQIDLAIGIWLFLFLLVKPSLIMVLWSLLLTLLLHVPVSSLSYLLKMRKTIL